MFAYQHAHKLKHRSSVQDEGPSTTLIVSSQSSSHLPPPEKKEERQSTCFSQSARFGLTFLAFLISTGVDTAQFKDGASGLDLTNALLLTLTGLYVLQASALNAIYTSESINEIFLLREGEKVPDWEELSLGEKCKAYTASTIIIPYAVFSDALIMAYYTKLLNWGLSTPLCVLIGTLASLSNIAEPYEALKFFRSYFSKSQNTYSAALEKIHQDNFYLHTPLEFQKNFDELMEEFSGDIKSALLKPNNVAYIIKNCLDLGEKLLEIFKNTEKEKIKRELIQLQLDQKTAEDFAVKLFALLLTREEHIEEKTYFKSCVGALDTGLDFTLIPFLKICGIIEEIIEAYTVMAAISEQSLGNNSQTSHWLLFAAGATNGITDCVFNGGIIKEAIKKLMRAIKTSDYTWAEMMIFLFSFTCAAMVAYAQKGLLEIMLNEPDAPYPDPLPAKFPEEVNKVLAYLALRELALYSSFFYDVFRIIATEVRIIKKNQKEKIAAPANDQEEKAAASANDSTDSAHAPLLPEHPKETRGCLSRCYARLFSSAPAVDNSSIASPFLPPSLTATPP
ncbi:MAG TPA: hypothetical protein VLI69_06800 [Gammaproteobacteria bacterium]|nr:hypothetical protein [Gammaproteobacteria bacterium]